MIAAVNVCENRIPALAGNEALKKRSPLVVELVKVIVDSEDPSPFAVSVPLIRIHGWDHGLTATRPSTSDIERERYDPTGRA